MGKKPASELRVLVKRVCWGEWKTPPPPKKKGGKETVARPLSHKFLIKFTFHIYTMWVSGVV